MLPNTSDLLSPLTAAGLTVRVVDGNRLAVVPAERITDNLRQHIRLHKSELLALLAANDPPPFAPAHESSVVQYLLLAGGGGILIDPDGIESAIQTLRDQYGAKLDWLALVCSDTCRIAYANNSARADVQPRTNERRVSHGQPNFSQTWRPRSAL